MAKLDENWETFLSQQHLRAYQRVRDLLSNPLFLNHAIGGHLSPGQLLDWTTTQQELRDLVLDRNLDRTLADQREYEPGDAPRYLSWIARFLSGDEISPFGRETSDYTVFDLADLTTPDPPRRYRLFGALVLGLVLGLVGGLVEAVDVGLGVGLFFGLVLALGFGLLQPRSVLIDSRTPKEARSRSVIAALTWLFSGLVGGLLFGMILRAMFGLPEGTLYLWLILVPFFGLAAGLVLALRNGGWFVVLQRVAHRRLARDGNLPPRPYDFLEWAIEQQIFRRVGGGVLFRHNLIQQQLAK